MTVKSEMRRFNQGNVKVRPLKKSNGGVHGCGQYERFCTRCGSQRHSREQCDFKEPEFIPFAEKQERMGLNKAVMMGDDLLVRPDVTIRKGYPSITISLELKVMLEDKDE